MHQVITTTAALQAFCAGLKGDSFIAVDTEFMREKTYYPELCLVQVAGDHSAAAIDTLADGIDLAPLYTVLADSALLKVFHACRQDMEIFYHHMQTLPAPIFDTQIAAMVCGYGESAGYETLVNKLLRLPVDKSSRFTDWARRPLSDKQIDYAMNDVLHLREIYKHLRTQLEEAGRLDWTEEEMRLLARPDTYRTDPEEAWRKIRFRNSTPRYLAMLKATAKWRELTAQARNVPRGRVMKDETLAEVAHARPTNFPGLQAIRGFYPTLQPSHYDELFTRLREMESLPSSEYPRLAERPVLTPGTEALVDLLRLFLKACTAAHQVVPRLVADKEDLEALALGKREGLLALTGWRAELFGNRAIQLLEGKIALRADGKNGIGFIDLAG